MRVHINKALKTQCKAIQTALKKYNAAAATLGQPPLDWKHISTYGSLAEFLLLQECWADIRHQPWAQASNHQAAVYNLKIQGALVEQICLNMEVHCLATSLCRDCYSYKTDKSSSCYRIRRPDGSLSLHQ